MSYIIEALYKSSKAAGAAISNLKEAGYSHSISVIAKDWDDAEIKRHAVEDSDASTGTIVGAVVGGLATLIATTGAVAVPGLGTLLVAGPVATLMTVAGALAGGLVGFLVKSGITEERAKMYEDAVKRGEVLVIITTDTENEEKIKSILKKHMANEIYVRD